jgi:hypothetical protein
MYTGADPRDESFYVRARSQPTFYGGLPYLRLERDHSRLRRGGARGELGGAPAHPFAIHGPVTPTLIWGMVSAGCVRMRPADLRYLYAVAVRHPAMAVSFVRAGERRAREVERTRRPPRGCAEAAVGVRPLRRLRLDVVEHDRVCGGVDHWYAVELRGGDTLSLRAQHAGALRLELYGIRAISTVAEGRHQLDHTVPLAHRNRGDRYLRVVAPAGSRGNLPYTLCATLGGLRGADGATTGSEPLRGLRRSWLDPRARR